LLGSFAKTIYELTYFQELKISSIQTGP